MPQLSDFNNFWYKYVWDNWPPDDFSLPNDFSSSRLTQRLFLHYMGKSEQAKHHIFIQDNVII